MTRAMTRVLLASTALFATPALAHIGHIGEAAGHGHWIAGIAIGVAVGVGLWGALKGKKDPEAEPEEALEEDAEEEPA